MSNKKKYQLSLQVIENMDLLLKEGPGGVFRNNLAEGSQ